MRLATAIAFRRLGQVVRVLRTRRVTVVDGQGQEDAARMVDAAKAGVGDEIEALLAAIVGMGAPADVGDQAGGVTQSPLCGCFTRARAVRIAGPSKRTARRRVDGTGSQARILGTERE